MDIDRYVESFYADLEEVREQLAFDHSACCPICHQRLSLDDAAWMMPDEAALHMDQDEGYVCSEECAEEWRENYWDIIEEHRQRKLV